VEGLVEMQVEKWTEARQSEGFGFYLEYVGKTGN
jgi:hypothetical protein